MPPEPLPWDRKRSSSEVLAGGGGGGVCPPASRWRDSPQHQSHGSYRFGSSPDVRRPSGHGRHSGWHNEEFGYRVNDSKYSRNSREIRGSFISPDRKGQSWGTPATSNGNSYPHSEFVNASDQIQYKDQHDKSDGISNTGQIIENPNSSLSSTDWKPLKWARSGSLSSRGSGLSHSSSSKSIGVDSVEAKLETQPSTSTPLQSVAGDAVASACMMSSVPSEEPVSRKKPRLGWGEGLAKYEKKKVEGPEEPSSKEFDAKTSSKELDAKTSSKEFDVKNCIVDSGFDLELPQPKLAILACKLPSLTKYSECASPTTPSSVACSSSPGLEETSCAKAAPSEITNPSASCGPRCDGVFNFDLDNLKLTENGNLSSSLDDLLQSEKDPVSPDFCSVKITAISKLQELKACASKTLEITESEIDMLENELKLINSNSKEDCFIPSTSLPVEFSKKPFGGTRAALELIPRPSPLVITSGDVMNKTTQGSDEGHTEVKIKDVDSPGTATSKFVEPLSLCKYVTPSGAVEHEECSVKLEVRPAKVEAKSSLQGVGKDKSGVVSISDESIQYPASDLDILSTLGGVGADKKDQLYDLILAANRDSSNKASQIFSKLLPHEHSSTGVSRPSIVPCTQSDSLIKDKFALRKKFLRFKERVTSLKYRAYLQIWKEDLHLHSSRRLREKSQKKIESSLLPLSNYQKHRSSVRSRYASPVGYLSLVPTRDVAKYTSKLLSDSQVRIYRDELKMPALILNKKERVHSRFISRNGLVEDPCEVEKERCMINPWTSQEKEIFIEKLASLGKDFRKIATFLDHKTIADCVEFYYKNHKDDSFQKAKKKSEFAKERKSYSAKTYLVTSGKRWNREAGAVSLDLLGAASAIAADVEDGMENVRKCTSRFYGSTSCDYKKEPRGSDCTVERSGSLFTFGSEREAAAADVLAGICGSMSSEALSSCITSSVDRIGEQEWKSQKLVGSSKRRPTVEVMQRVVDDDTCSDESCGGEISMADWSDEEKSIFIQALASFGKDFGMISRCVRTRSREQCMIFFSKARKCLGLDSVNTEPRSDETTAANEGDGGTDTDDACVVDAGSVCCNKLSLECKMDEEEVQLPDLKVEHPSSDPADLNLNPGSDKMMDDNGVDSLVLVASDEDGKIVDVHVGDDEASDTLEVNPRVDIDGKIIDVHVGDDEASDTLEDNPRVDIVNNVISVGDASGEAVTAGVGGNLEDLRQGRDDEHAMPEEAISALEVNALGLPPILNTEVEVKGVGDVSAEKSIDGMEGPPRVEFDASVAHNINDLNISITGDLNTTSYASKEGNVPLESGVERGFEAEQEPVVAKVEQDDSCLSSKSLPKDSIAVARGKTLSHDDVSSKLNFRRSSDRMCQKSSSLDGHFQDHLSKYSVMECVDSSDVLRGYPVSICSKNGVDGNISCNESVASIQAASKFDTDLNLNRSLPRDLYLQKCSNSKSNCLSSDIPFSCHEQNQSSSTDVEKPCRGGNVKLFGQILSHPSPQPPKPKCSTHENVSTGTLKQLKLNEDGSFSLNFGSTPCLGKNLTPPIHERNNLFGVENNNLFGVENNFPTRSYGFWDGERIQTGFHSLPDSAILLAKYPSILGNMSAAARTEQQPLRPVMKSSERVLNGVSGPNGFSGFPTVEMTSSNQMAQVYRSRDLKKVVQPLTVDKLRQEFLFPGLQRQRESDAVSNVHQQGRGIVGRDGGILGGGACNGVSDPVAAIKMHFAKTEQYNGSIRREDDSWRGTGDIGSR